MTEIHFENHIFSIFLGVPPQNTFFYKTRNMSDMNLKFRRYVLNNLFFLKMLSNFDNLSKKAKTKNVISPAVPLNLNIIFFSSKFKWVIGQIVDLCRNLIFFKFVELNSEQLCQSIKGHAKHKKSYY